MTNSHSEISHTEAEQGFPGYFEITVVEGAPIAGRTLSEADKSGFLDEDELVVAIERDGEVLTPRGQTTIYAGDLVTVFSKQGVSGAIMQLFTGPE